MEEITHNLKKYIHFFSYDQPQSSLPFLLYTMIFVTVEINFFIAIKTEYGNMEKFLSGLVDFVMSVMIFSCFVRRALNKHESLRLLEVIEDKVVFNRRELKNREKKWLVIDYTQEKRRDHAARMAKNLYIILVLLGSLVITKNILKYMLGMYETSENEATRWPTPYLSYFSQNYDNFNFFIFFYILQAVVIVFTTFEGVLIFNSFHLLTEKLLTDFEILYILLEKLAEDFPDVSIEVDYRSVNNFVVYSTENDIEYSDREGLCNTRSSRINMSLKNDMRIIVALHQDIYRNFKICAYNFSYMLTTANFSVLMYGCTFAYLMLTSNDPKKTIHYAMFFILMNVTSFNAYNNGQRIFNQNDILRGTLTEVPWTDKPLWFKQTLLIMMTRANMDIEMRPYGIHTLNYMSFKELMKTVYSVGSVFRKYDSK